MSDSKSKPMTKTQREVYEIIRMKSNRDWFDPNDLIPYTIHQRIATCDRLHDRGLLIRRSINGFWEYRLSTNNCGPLA